MLLATAQGCAAARQRRLLTVRQATVGHCNWPTQHKRTRCSALSTAFAAYSDFSKAATGEWEGVSVSFSSSGTPEPLPEYYVPAAYREWGVELFDWQTHCSSLATDTGLRVVVKRLMPTVGCEADAVAFVEEANRMFAELLDRGCPPTVLPDGSYSTGPLQLGEGDNKLVVESCFAGQAAGRVKVVQHLMKGWQDGRWFTCKVDVHNEMYDAPFSAGSDIRSCGYRLQNFSQEPRAAVEQLRQPWDDARGTRYTVQYDRQNQGRLVGVDIKDIQGGRLAPAIQLAEPMALPLGVWCAVHHEDDCLVTAAGLLPSSEEELFAQLAVRMYVDVRLQEVVLGREKKMQ